MILYNLFFLLVSSVHAISSQPVTEQMCAIIPNALPAQMEICYTKLAKQTGNSEYCNSIPTNEGIGRCKGYLLALQKPSWTYVVHNMLWYYLAAIALITLVITTERKEFLLGLSSVALFSFLLHWLASSTTLPLLDNLMTALLLPIGVVPRNVPTWFSTVPVSIQAVLLFVVTYGQCVGHIFGWTKRHILFACIFALGIIVLTSYADVLYAFLERYFNT